MIITGGLTFAYMLKLFVTLFVERDANAHAHNRYLSIPSSIALAASASLVWFSGIFSGAKDFLAGWGKAFFHGNPLRYGMNYLEWANISGALISIAIGAGVYFAVVRCLLMRRQEGGGKAHIVLLPPKLVLEDSVYRPCLNFLAKACVFVMGGIVYLLEAFFRLLPSWTDSFTNILSSLPAVVSELMRATFKRVDNKSDVLRKEASFKALRINQQLQTLRAKSAMAGNFQFDLFLLGVGACVTLIFMLVQALR
jgi:hydrogenase-4 component B